jgi:hypothetical protein
MLADFLPV